MNLRRARVVLRPRDAMAVLDLAAPFCVRNWRLFVPLAGAVLVPAFAVCLLAHHLLHWSWPAVWLLAVGLGGLAHAPFTIACGEALFHDPRQVRLGSVLGRALRRAPSLAAVHVVSRLMNLMAVGVLILVPFTAGTLLVVHEAVLLEGAGPFAAIARSGRAVRGQGGAAFGIAVALFLLPVVGVLAGELSLNTLVATGLQLGEPFGTLWQRGGTPYALGGFFATVPLSAGARFLKYIDLRTRKEGWDIQLRFMAAAAGAEVSGIGGGAVASSSGARNAEDAA